MDGLEHGNTDLRLPLGQKAYFQRRFVSFIGSAWRIIPVSKWLVTTIYKPFRPFVRGTTLPGGLTITMVINHLLTGMILQVY